MRFGIRKKLTLSFFSIILIFIVTMLLSFWMSQNVKKLTNEILQLQKQEAAVANINLFARSANDNGANYLLAPPSLQGNYKDRYNANIEYLNKELALLEKQLSKSTKKEFIAPFKDKWSAYLVSKEEIFNLFENGEVEQAQSRYTKDSFDPVAFSLLSFSKELQSLQVQKELEIEKQQTTSSIISVSLLILSIVIASLIAYVFALRLTNRINQLKTQSVEVASGNLQIDAIHMNSKDELEELANSFNVMTQSLRDLIGEANNVSSQVAAASAQLQASSEQTSSASEHISTIMQEIAVGTGEQTIQIKENQATLEELATHIEDITERTKTVSELITTTTSSAEKGKKDLDNAISQVKTIEKSTKGISATISHLDTHSRAISDTLGVITAIAEQTNLLALNAAIEAARAGESGKGFAVVADEVRKLAVQSQGSATLIQETIARIQSETSKAVEEMAKGSTEVEKGIVLIGVAGESFEVILSKILLITQQIQEVTSSSVEISSQTKQVTEGFEIISEVSSRANDGTQNVSAAAEEQSASMQEISASSESLAQLAQQLRDLISKFKY